jgi:hypothetical protein
MIMAIPGSIGDKLMGSPMEKLTGMDAPPPPEPRDIH